MTPIEKLKELVTALGDDHFDGISEDTLTLNALIDLAPSFIALWEAVNEDVKDEEGSPCTCPRPVCTALAALNAAAARVLHD